jgi:hypothetical protein
LDSNWYFLSITYSPLSLFSPQIHPNVLPTNPIILPHPRFPTGSHTDITETENVATDLESFSRHAGRTTVTADDVLLVTRRNEALHGIIQDFIDKEKAKRGKGKARIGAAKASGTGAARGRPRKSVQ